MRVVSAVAEAQRCTLTEFVRLVSGKWALPILYRLATTQGRIRFGELKKLAHPITQKELTKQLRLLEARGLVYRTVYAEAPPRVEYEASLTARALIPSLEGLAQWTRDHGASLLKPA